MKKLDQYIISQAIKPALIGFGFFTVVFMVDKILKILNLIIVKQAPLMDVLRTLLYSMPELFSYTIPMGVIMGITYSFARMNSENELLGFLTLGIPPQRLLLPVLAVGIVSTAFMFYWLQIVYPASNYMHALSIRNLLIKSPAVEIEPRKFINLGKITLYVEKIDPKTGRLWGVVIYEEPDPQKGRDFERWTTAARGKWDYENKMLELFDGAEQQVSPGSGKIYRTVKFDYLNRKFDVGMEKQIKITKGPRDMTIKELKEKIKKSKGYLTTILRTELFKRTADALNLLVFVLLGAVAGSYIKSAPLGNSFVFTVSISFLSYSLGNIFQGLGKAAILPATISLFAPHLVFLGATVFLFKRRFFL